MPAAVLTTPPQPTVNAGALYFGSWAGYGWRGPVKSIQGSWAVPLVLGSSPLGDAGTWIGAQAPLPGSTSPSGVGTGPSSNPSSELGAIPFIQVGTNEERGISVTGRVYDAYYAFWTDTVHHFSPIGLFAVRPGDRISTSLVLAHRRWTVSILDHNSGAHRTVSTHDEAAARFDLASWLQEHTAFQLAGSREQYTYPQLSTVRMSGLRVNSTDPRYADVTSNWMTADGTELAPSPLVNDTFSIRPVPISPEGKHYLTIASALNRAGRTFFAQQRRWTSSTPRDLIAAQRDRYLAAIRDNVTALADAQWPTAVEPLIAALIHEQRAELRHHPDLAVTPTRATRTTTSEREAAHYTIVNAIRRALNIPQLTRPL